MIPQLISAMRRGYESRMKKIAREDNPYEDLRNGSGRLTFSRAFRNAWFEGYDMCKGDEYHGDYDGWYDERVEKDVLGMSDGCRRHNLVHCKLCPEWDQLIAERDALRTQLAAAEARVTQLRNALIPFANAGRAIDERTSDRLCHHFDHYVGNYRDAVDAVDGIAKKEVVDGDQCTVRGDAF